MRQGYLPCRACFCWCFRIGGSEVLLHSIHCILCTACLNVLLHKLEHFVCAAQMATNATLKLTQEVPETTISDLPQPCLIHILEAVSLQDRMQYCCLVSRAWKEATRLATTDICADVSTQERADSLCSWLFGYSPTGPRPTMVRRLKLKALLAAPSFVQIHMPDSHCLDTLIVEGQDTSPLNGFSFSLSCCCISLSDDITGLTHLALDHCDKPQMIVSSKTGFTQLSQLRHLSLSNINTADGPLRSYGDQDAGQESVFGEDLDTGLSSLRQLTHQSLGCQDRPESNPADVFRHDHFQHMLDLNPPADWVLQHLSSLMALKELQLCMHLTTAGLQGATALSNLTWLLLDNTLHVNIDNSMPGLSNLSILQRLQLRKSGSLDPSVLTSMQQLRYLELSDVTMTLPKAASTAAVLAAAQQLQHLTYLSWANNHSTALERLDAHEALTANSRLQELHVEGVLVSPVIFLKGKLQPQLHAFSWLGSPPFPLHKLCNISDAFPNLQELAVRFEISNPHSMTDSSLGPLQSLLDLTQLVLSAANSNIAGSGSSKHGSSIVGLVAGLTRLRELGLSLWDEPARSELLVLTQLVRLTKLAYQAITRQRRVLLSKVRWHHGGAQH